VYKCALILCVAPALRDLEPAFLAAEQPRFHLILVTHEEAGHLLCGANSISGRCLPHFKIINSRAPPPLPPPAAPINLINNLFSNCALY